MIGQLLIVGLLVALALGYLARVAWRAWNVSREGCGGGCGCDASAKSPPLIPPESLRLRRPPQSGNVAVLAGLAIFFHFCT